MPQAAPIRISDFARDANLLNTPLWPKQSDILEDFWSGDYAIAVWSLGRRSGKTTMAAILATFAACMLADQYKLFLRKGERFYIVSVANTIDQARIALQGVKDLINGSPILKPLVVKETAESLELKNGAIFKAMPASGRGGRGMACPLVIFDELAHALDTDGNAAGASLYQALSPSVAQFGKLGKILMLSSPWTQQGIFWELYKQGQSGQFKHIQVVQAPTWEINPTISREFLEQEKARDPEMFCVEYGAEFSQSLSTFLSPELIDAAIAQRSVLFPRDKYRGEYVCSLDPAKGNRDAYTACIAHYEGDRFIIDKFHQFKASYSDGKRQQVSIAEVEEWLIKNDEVYGFKKVVLDQYNSQATIQRLSPRLDIEELTWTQPKKTQAFSKLRELFNAGRIELYPHDQAIKELKGLIVLYKAGGAWSVSGGTGAAVDDFAAALAGAVLIAEDTEKEGGWDWIKY